VVVVLVVLLVLLVLLLVWVLGTMTSTCMAEMEWS
jgi:hypothetical protein